MNQLYDNAVSSPEKLVQFLVDTQYDQVLTRAIGAKVANSNVGRQALYTEIMKIVSGGDTATFEYLFAFPLQTSASNNDEANQAVQMLIAAGQRPKARIQVPAYCQPSFTGPLSAEQAENCALVRQQIADQQAGTQSTINSALGILNTLLGGLGTWLTGDTPAPSGTSNGTPAPAPAPQADYTPWIIGGVAALVLIVIVFLLLRKK